MKVLWLLHLVSASPSHSALLEAEAKAMDEATLFAWDVGVMDVIFETDSISVSHALVDPANAKITIASLVAGTHSKLQKFRSFEVSHVKRQANFPAHALAACAKDIDFFVSWMEECPPFIESQVFHDALSLSSY